jgi:hypothetical protein
MNAASLAQVKVARRSSRQGAGLCRVSSPRNAFHYASRDVNWDRSEVAVNAG